MTRWRARAVLAAHAAVLRMYPRAFRARYGAELSDVAATVLEHSNESGGGGVMRAGAALVWDGMAGLPGAWAGVLAGRARGEEDANPFSERRGPMMLDVIGWELRQATRRLRRTPWFTIAAVATLAVGMGANVALFGIVDAMLLEPLPYRDAGDLVALSSTRKGEEISVSYPDLLDWRARSRAFEDIAGYVGASYNLTGNGDAVRVRGETVTANLFTVLGVSAALGRTFDAKADEPGAAREVILSHGMWREKYGGAPDVVGRAIRLSDEAYTVIGVMPAGFAFPDGIVFSAPDVWLPAGLSAADWDTRQSHPGIVGIARLAPGVPFETARSELMSIAAQIAAEHPDTNEDESVLARPALDALVGDVRPTLVALLGAVGFVLLIACANVANLMLVRSSARAQEVSLRTALGAGRARLALEALAESLVLAVAGGILGLLFARSLISAGLVLVADLPREADAGIDTRIVVFTILLTLMTAALFGVIPAVARARSVGGGVVRATGQRVSARIRGGFVVAQIALALMLLIGAGVLVKSFEGMARADGGIDPTDVATFSIRLPEARYTEEATALFYENLLSDFTALDGVVSAGGISTLPFSGSGAQSGIVALGVPGAEGVRTDVAVVTRDYFRTMGVRVLRGRVFDERDRAGAPAVVVVDERFAERAWPGEEAVGRRVQGWGLDGATVIGVVPHVKNYGIASDSRQEMYMAHAQRPYFRMILVVRLRDDLARALPSLREVVRRADPDLPVDGVRRMSDVVSRTVSTPRLAAIVGAAFAVLATLLAGVGLYGVVAYGVSLRVREIGTRVALGARSGQVLRLVIRQAMGVAVAGVLVGLAGAWGVTRLLEGLLFGVTPRDASTFIALPLVLLAVAAVAGWVPARRAARISPLEALRGD